MKLLKKGKRPLNNPRYIALNDEVERSLSNINSAGVNAGMSSADVESMIYTKEYEADRDKVANEISALKEKSGFRGDDKSNTLWGRLSYLRGLSSEERDNLELYVNKTGGWDSYYVAEKGEKIPGWNKKNIKKVNLDIDFLDKFFGP